MNDKYKRAAKFRKIYSAIVVLLDLILCPWFAQFPSFVAKNMSSAPQEWLSFGPINSYKALFESQNTLLIFLSLQVFILAFLFSINFNPRSRRVNIIQDGVGGPAPAGDGQFGTSRWLTKAERDKANKIWYAFMSSISSAGIVFGMEHVRDKEKIWYDNDDKHTLIIGATRSGKSRKLILPTIGLLAQAGESMILGDPKAELYLSSAPYLQSMGYNVIVINIREPEKGNQWNMLDVVNRFYEEENVPAAVEAAWDIAHSLSHQKPSVTSEPIWENGEESVIAALCMLASFNTDLKAQKHISTAFHLLSEMGQPITNTDIVPLVEYIKGLPVKHPAKSAFATASVAPAKTRASFFTQTLADMRLFSDPNIADMTSKQDHIMENIGVEKTAVFLIIPDEKSTRNVLATLYVNQVYQALVNLANKRGGRIPRRVNIILDEFGNLPPIPDFDKKITVGGGRGIRFTLAVQGLDQIKALYKEKANTISGNCQNWIYISTQDPDTAKILSEKVGKYTVETENIGSSYQSRGSDSSSRNYGLVGRSLVDPAEILRWPENEVLVLQKSQFPARYPCPDLSRYSFNNLFGFAKSSGNVEADKEKNRKIIECRLNSLNSRTLFDPVIWLPQFSLSSGPAKPASKQSQDDRSSEILDMTFDQNSSDFLG